MDGDRKIGGTTTVLAKAQPFADHLFVSPNGGLDPAPLGVIGNLLPTDPALLGNTLKMTVALCGLGFSAA
jgi:hypothetical protein